MNKGNEQQKERGNKGISALKKAVQAISTGILIICTLLCFVVVIRTAVDQDASVFGYRLFYVVTGSMEPTIPTNSLLLVKEQDSYEVGDIITYRAKDLEIMGQPNTHRIIDKTVEEGETRYITQGDANPVPDVSPVLSEDIIGKMCFCFGMAGFIGTLLSLLSTPYGFFLVVLLPLLTIAVICMKNIRKALNEELKKAAMASLEAEMAENKDEKEENHHEAQ